MKEGVEIYNQLHSNYVFHEPGGLMAVPLGSPRGTKIMNVKN
jgi:hypothetical protein